MTHGHRAFKLREREIKGKEAKSNVFQSLDQASYRIECQFSIFAVRMRPFTIDRASSRPSLRGRSAPALAGVCIGLVIPFLSQSIHQRLPAWIQTPEEPGLP